MNGITLTWSQLLFVAAIVIAVYALELVFFLLKNRKAPAAPPNLLDQVELLQDQIAVLKRELTGVQDKLRNAPEVAARAEPEVAETAYGQAMKLAQQGLDSSAVAAGCGISRGEAELIVALYRASLRP